jgi:hypothetical protein
MFGDNGAFSALSTRYEDQVCAVERDYRAWDGDRTVIDTGQLSVEESVRTILAEVPADR